jgi:GAF domain-containing protein
MTLQQALDALTRQALDVADVRSAALFIREPGSSTLALGAAAGIAGPALDGLTAAVRDPAHPVARALNDDGPTFDVQPVAPGGPALRSHLPVREGDRTLGVLALAHDGPMSAPDRATLIDLARTAAAALDIEAT